MMDYRSAGVNVAEGRRAVEQMRAAVEATHNSAVLTGLGSFGALYHVGSFMNADAVLVSGTDGVGTKVEVARAVGQFDTIGIDCVAMCVNDVLCHGARPLFFLDYVAVDSLNADAVARIVAGVAEGCRRAECALIGGETAEMPGVYAPGAFDLAGFCVGIVDRPAIVDGSAVAPGMAVIGLASSGLHSNGFTLVRSLIRDYQREFEGAPIWRTLLEPTRIYTTAVHALLAQVKVYGLAHVTGGGWYENLPRMVGTDCDLVIQAAAVPRPPIFHYLESLGVAAAEMYRTFNMGLGMAAIVAPADRERAVRVLNAAGVPAWPIGIVEVGTREVRIC